MRALLFIPIALLLGACAGQPRPPARELGIAGIAASKAADAKGKTATIKASSSVTQATSSARQATKSIRAAQVILEEPLPQKVDEQAFVVERIRKDLAEAIIQIETTSKKLEDAEAQLSIAIEASGQKEAAVATLEASVKSAEAQYATAISQNDDLRNEAFQANKAAAEAKASKSKWVWQALGLYTILAGLIAWKLKAFLLLPSL